MEKRNELNRKELSKKKGIGKMRRRKEQREMKELKSGKKAGDADI